MLDQTEPTTSTTFEKDRLVGKEQERRRIVQMFHDEVSSGLLGAVFKIHMAKEKLKSANSPEAEPVSEASEMLLDAIDKIGEALRNERRRKSPVHRIVFGVTPQAATAFGLPRFLRPGRR